MAAEGKSDRVAVLPRYLGELHEPFKSKNVNGAARAELTRMVKRLFSFSHALHLILPLPEINSSE
jgi:hypothetical protein